jgi:hypothetical protein
VAEFDQDLFKRALDFAARVHGDQKVPGSGLPYVVHVAKVAMEVLAATDEDESAVRNIALACALLHDTVEDSGPAEQASVRQRIRAEFGPEVADDVDALTKDHRLPKSERMADSLRRIRRHSRAVWLVKLADRITNLEPPPPSWSTEKCIAYAAEARTILATLGEASDRLRRRFEQKLTEYVADRTRGQDPCEGEDMSPLAAEASRVMVVPSKAEVLARVCAAVGEHQLDRAAEILQHEYPFAPEAVAKRSYGPIECTRVFARDGFIDRYSGERLVFPPVLRILSTVLPTQFPFDPNWKTDVTHRAYWDLQATLDHVVPVTRGGRDDESNWVTTSQVRNSAKGNWSLEQLGWRLHPPGSFREWDGLMRWFLEYASKHPEVVAANASIRGWHRAAQRVIAEVE